MKISPLRLARGLLSLLFFQTSWSYKGKQGLGLKFVLLNIAQTRQQRQRIMEHARGSLNTNPFAAGAIVGAIARAEFDVQELTTIDRFAWLAQRVLAAAGDRFFWHDLRPALTALAVLLALYGVSAAPLFFLIGFNVVAQGTRALGMHLGYTRGRDCVPELQKRFDQWSRIIAIAAALFTGAVFAYGILGCGRFHTDHALAMLGLTAFALWAMGRRRWSPTLILTIALLIFAAAKLSL